MAVYKPENSEAASRIYSSVDDIVIKYTAEWCGPCKRIAPVFEKLSQEYSDIVFMEVDVDKCIGFAGNIKSLPTFNFIHNKNSIMSFSGADEKNLTVSMTKFNEYLNNIYAGPPGI